MWARQAALSADKDGMKQQVFGGMAGVRGFS